MKLFFKFPHTLILRPLPSLFLFPFLPLHQSLSYYLYLYHFQYRYQDFTNFILIQLLQLFQLPTVTPYFIFTIKLMLLIFPLFVYILNIIIYPTIQYQILIIFLLINFFFIISFLQFILLPLISLEFLFLHQITHHIYPTFFLIYLTFLLLNGSLYQWLIPNFRFYQIFCYFTYPYQIKLIIIIIFIIIYLVSFIIIITIIMFDQFYYASLIFSQHLD